MYDYLITGGEILDGSGGEAVRADIALQDGKIVAVGQLKGESARETLDAEGCAVAPGFVDMHSHDDFNLPLNPLVPGKILQGVTTQVTGQCGWTPAPILDKFRKAFIDNASFLDSGLAYDWSSFAEYMDKLPSFSVNVAQLVGHVAVRSAAMGIANRAPSEAELATMRSLVAEAMDAGAFGFSTGLIYPPSSFGKTDEIVELAKVAAAKGGGYFTHMRDESLGIWDAVREAADVGKAAGCRVQISHLKLSGQASWGKADQLLRLLDDLRAEGLQILADQYPYPAGSSGLKSVLPQWALEGGTDDLIARLENASTRDQIRAEVLEGMSERGYMKIGTWEDVMIAESPSNPANAGHTLVELGQRDNKLPVDVMLDMVLADYAKTLAIFFSIGVDDMRLIMADPNVCIGSDGIITSKAGVVDQSKPHPRYYGTFPRVLGRYAREENLFSLPEAVRKMTSLSADALGLKDRGRIAEGQWADLVIFQPDSVRDTATYKDPINHPAGVNSVFVNGTPVVMNQEVTGETPGAMLRPA